jgi:hypothetical protein
MPHGVQHQQGREGDSVRLGLYPTPIADAWPPDDSNCLGKHRQKRLQEMAEQVHSGNAAIKAKPLGNARGLNIICD